LSLSYAAARAGHATLLDSSQMMRSRIGVDGPEGQPLERLAWLRLPAALHR